MRRKSKPFLIVIVILLGIPLLITLGLNLYLQSPGTQQRLRSALESILGSPVSIRSTFGMPFGEIRLNGLTTLDNEHSPLVSASALTIRPDYIALLHGRVTIEALALDHPVVRLTINSSQERPSPSTGGGAASMLPSAMESDQAAVPPSPSPGNTPTEATPPAQNEREANAMDLTFPSDFNNFSIRNGEILLQASKEDVSGAMSSIALPVISFSDFNLQAQIQQDGTWSGIITAKNAVVGNNALIIRELHSPAIITLNHSSVILEKFSATLGGGTLAGSLQCDLPPRDPAYKATLQLSGASLKQLLADSYYGASSAEGSLSGELLLSGIAGNPATMEGGGTLSCTEAVIQPVDFLKQIGQILQIDELQLLRLAEAKCQLHIHQCGIVVDDLLLRSQNLMLTARGPITSSGELDLESRLLLNEKLTGRLRGLLGSQLVPAPEPGYSQLTFHVSGNPANPRTDLLQRITGLKIGIDLGGLLQGLFGHPATNH